MRETAAAPERRPPSLLEVVQGLLQRTYRMRCGLAGLDRFVIGDRGYQLLYGAAGPVRAAASADGAGARTLVRESDEGLRACIYYPDALIRQLEQYPPHRGVGEENVDPFAALVEELDHLLCLAERTAEGREITLFELELHANVSKHLVLSRFLAGNAGRLSPRRRLWLRHQLFDNLRFCDDDEQVRSRYRDAARWAVRFIDALAGWSGSERLDALRRFHRASARGKLDLIESVAS